jgi:hypothetical protein
MLENKEDENGTERALEQMGFGSPAAACSQFRSHRCDHSYELATEGRRHRLMVV